MTQDEISAFISERSPYALMKLPAVDEGGVVAIIGSAPRHGRQEVAAITISGLQYQLNHKVYMREILAARVDHAVKTIDRMLEKDA